MPTSKDGPRWRERLAGAWRATLGALLGQAGRAGDGARRFISVRTKGALACAALIACLVLIAVFASEQRNALRREFDTITVMLETEALLERADSASLTLLEALLDSAATIDQAAMLRIGAHYQSLLASEAELAAHKSGSVLDMHALGASWMALRTAPGPANLSGMIAQVMVTKKELAALALQAQGARLSAFERYRRHSESLPPVALLLSLVGLGSLIAVTGVFFARLGNDLAILRQRALAIMKDDRAEPLPVTRRDEVGQLMEALNAMAETFDRHEKEVILKRQKLFHQEKMAAIGALAAGLSHEIGNPIAAICGIAEEMVARRQRSADCWDECRPEMIYAQAERLAKITREFSEFAAPRASEPQFLDLNALLRSISRLICYDARLQQVSLRLDLDSQLPAVYGVADQLAQVAMNLLINAVDGLEAGTASAPTITIATRAEPGCSALTIEDNGEGIEPANLGRVFEAFFTTKPAGKGTGLGLSLCYAIVQRHGGTIEIDSTPGAGTRVQVCFPLDDTAYNEASPL